MAQKKMSKENLTSIFHARLSDTEQEWKQLKKEFISSGVDVLLLEKDVDSFTFHIVYNKIINLSDKEIFENIIEEL